MTCAAGASPPWTYVLDGPQRRKVVDHLGGSANVSGRMSFDREQRLRWSTAQGMNRDIKIDTRVPLAMAGHARSLCVTMAYIAMARIART